jgi:hypothetical protein
LRDDGVCKRFTCRKIDKQQARIWRIV